MTSHLLDTLDRSVATMTGKMAEVMPTATSEERQVRELMSLLHAALFVIQHDESSTAEELRQFAGQALDRTRITRQ